MTKFFQEGTDRIQRARCVGISQDLFFGSVAMVAWAGLVDQAYLTWRWLGPGIILALWAVGQNRIQKGRGSRLRQLGWAGGTLAVGSILPHWPGASTSLTQVYVVALSLLATRLGRVAASMAEGPDPTAAEKGRTFLLTLLLLVTWWAYFTWQIVGILDERWYGDLMADFLGQTRAGIYPVLVGQGAFAWNGNIHPFRSAPLHHNLGALVDILTLQQLSPLAVQHLALLVCVFAAALILYVGMRRLRSDRPWLATLITAFFVTCPAVTLPQIQHDMYMTMTALPVVVFILVTLVFALETGAWRSWVWLGIGLGAVWFCHPPVALMTTGGVGLTLLFWALATPVRADSWLKLAAAGACFSLTSIGYFISMKEISKLRDGASDPVSHVVIPGLAVAVVMFSAVNLFRYSRPIHRIICGLGIFVGLRIIMVFTPAIFLPAVQATGLSLLVLGAGHYWNRTGLRNFPELVFLGSALAVGVYSGLSPSVGAGPDTYLSALREGYKPLWLPLRLGGREQIGYAIAVGLVISMIVLLRKSQPVAQAFFATTLLLFAGLAPIPGFSRMLWGNAPKEIVDVIGIGYFLRFLPVTAPFAVVVIFLVLSRLNPNRTYRGIILVLVGLVSWSSWENYEAAKLSWSYRHSAEQSEKKLLPENRPLSRFHYDLLPYPSYHNHGVADLLIETRIGYGKLAGDEKLGPDAYADAMADAQRVPWSTPVVRQDPTYPAWLYFEPKIVLPPGSKKLITFKWKATPPQGWLIARGKNIYREYILPDSGGPRAFGGSNLSHHTLSFWNTGRETEDVELVIKREGVLANQRLVATEKILQLRIVDYDASAAPVEVTRLQPLQLKIRADKAAFVESFRSWLPGYRVSVNGNPVPYSRSINGLVEFQVPAGNHVVDIRFRGTPELRWAVRWSLLMVFLICVGVGFEVLRVAQTRPAYPSNPE